MATRQRKHTKIGLGLLVAALVLAIVPPQGWAQQVSPLCPGRPGVDTDGDGLFDTEECAGLTLPPGAQPGAAGAVRFSPCTVPLTPPRTSCLDPGSKDIFVIQILPSGSHILRLGINPLEFVSRPQDQGGLGLTPHVITSAQTGTVTIGTVTHAQVVVNRGVGLPQKAVKFVENVASTTGNVLGIASQGGINTSAKGVTATVYTSRIITFINSVFANAGVTPTTAVRDDIIRRYILHTNAHELGHTLALALDYNVGFGGNHLQPLYPAFWIMEQFVTYSTATRGSVTFSISDDWDVQSQAVADLF